MATGQTPQQAIALRWEGFLTEQGYVNPKIVINTDVMHGLSTKDISINYDSLDMSKSNAQYIMKNKSAFENDIIEKIYNEINNFFS